MAKMIQIRHVSDEVHRTLKVRATQAGMSLSDYLREEIEEIAAKPTLAEMRERLSGQRPVRIGSKRVVAAIREGREEHDRRWS